MIVIRITINKDGLARLQNFTQGKCLIKGALRDIVREGGRTLRDNILKRYDAEVDPDGAAWHPLSPATRKRKGGRGKMLVESGRLRHSIKIHPQGRYKVSIRPEGHRNERVGAFHQFGRPSIPTRPFLGISPSDILQIETLALARIRQLIHSDGGS